MHPLAYIAINLSLTYCFVRTIAVLLLGSLCFVRTWATDICRKAPCPARCESWETTIAPFAGGDAKFLTHMCYGLIDYEFYLPLNVTQGNSREVLLFCGIHTTITRFTLIVIARRCVEFLCQ
jgi:hypothetical protein